MMKLSGSLPLRIPKATRKETRKISKNRLCRIIKRQLRASFRKTAKISQLFPHAPLIEIELLIEKRAEVQAVRIYGYGNSAWAICPNCDNAVERDYQRYCEQCGQLLAWNKFSQGRVVIQRTLKKNSDNQNAIRPNSLETTQSV